MMTNLPQAHAHILEIQPYKPGKSTSKDGQRVIKLSSNESPFGPSPRALEAIQNAIPNLRRYPDGMAQPLRQAIADTYALPFDNLICGNGSDELIGLLIHAYAAPGDNIVYSEHGFLMYKIYAQGFGVDAITAPEQSYTADVDALLAAVNDRTKIVFLANPNNPTGSWVPKQEIARLREQLPDHVLLVIDAAYAEYPESDGYSAGHELVAATDNTVMLRTFSKIYALPALRIGWGYAPAPVIDVLNRIRSPFNVNSMGMVAGEAAVRDQAHIDRARQWNAVCLQSLPPQFSAMGITPYPSVGNFLMLGFSSEEGKTADAANDYLMEHGIILRKIAAYGLPHCLRMTFGTEDENKAVTEALDAFMKQ